ncbi:BICD family-like cargo adapter 2 [Daphnia carinata]|uniref:BICD family-like cargo adapter 2 n=1 Tax=Daphnia carinata TaxID=120202 RepID=UPI002868FE59|nr:BICD family-like cargo adapter 2 [Daphnia carinata]
MKKESLIALTIFMAVWVGTHVEASNTQVSSISEKTRTSWNQTFTLDEAYKKCAEYLRTTLAEFLQKVNKTANNDGTQNMGQKVEDELNKHIHALMGKCDPTTLRVSQFVSTKVEPRERSLRVEQLVIQKIQLTPNLRKVGSTDNVPMNCTNTGVQTGVTTKPLLAMRTLSSKECTESLADLVDEWLNQKYQLDENAILIEDLQKELAACKANFTTVHGTDVKKIGDEEKEIDQLKKSLADKDAEIARLKSEKLTADQNNQKLVAEKIEYENQVKNLKEQVQMLEMNATKLIDKTLCEAQTTQQEQNLTIKCDEEKKIIAAECANKVEQLKNEMSVLTSQKEAEAKRYADEIKALTTISNFVNKTIYEDLKRQSSLSANSVTINNLQTSFENEKNSTATLATQLQQCNQKTTECVTNASQKEQEWAKKEAELQDEKKKCENEKASQNIMIENLKIQQQQVNESFSATQSANSQTINNLQTSLANEKNSANALAAQLQQCNQKTADCSTNASQKEQEWLKKEIELQGEKKKCEDEKASQKMTIDNLIIQQQQLNESCSASQSANILTIDNLQTSLASEQNSAASLRTQLQQCNQKMTECIANVGQKEQELTRKETELQDEKKKCDDKINNFQITIQQGDAQHANELKICQDSVAASKTETSKLEAVTTEKNQQIQACIGENGKLTSELASANIGLKTLNESATSLTVMKEQYEKVANACHQDTAVLMRAIGRRNQKFLTYVKLIESDSFMSIVGLSEKAQNDLNIAIKLLFDTNPLHCSQNSTYIN